MTQGDGWSPLKARGKTCCSNPTASEFSNVACRPEAQTLHCVATLDQDVGAALPYLNEVLGGYTYIKEPPSVTFRSQGKLIAVHADRIAINAVKSPMEAETILAWLQREINAAWERRAEISPALSRPHGPRSWKS